MSEIQYLPGELDIETYQNDTFSKVITLTQDGDPVDLSNAVVSMQIRGASGTAVLLSLTEGNGLTVVDNTIAIQKTIPLEKGRYKYDLQVIYNGNIVRTYLAGSFTVQSDITR